MISHPQNFRLLKYWNLHSTQKALKKWQWAWRHCIVSLVFCQWRVKFLFIPLTNIWNSPESIKIYRNPQILDKSWATPKFLGGRMATRSRNYTGGRQITTLHCTQFSRPSDLATWRPGDLETWQPGDLETWRPDHLATWRPGDLAAWRPGDLATWRPGDLATWRPGDLATWRPGAQNFCTQNIWQIIFLP